MRKLIIGAATLTGFLATSAMAADMPVKAPIYKAPPPPAYSWTGCYVGVQGGYESSRDRSTYGANNLGIAPGTVTSATERPRGGTLGPVVGCNYQAGHWVFGLEADDDFIHKSSTQVETLFPNFRVEVEQRWFGTVRGRIGYAADRGFIIPLPTLFYVTGGGASAGIRTANFVPGNAALSVSQSQTYSGWTVGWCSEYALGGGWSIKSDTLYARLGNRSNFAANDPVAVAVFNTSPRNIWISRIGLNYRFNWGGPVVARY